VKVIMLQRSVRSRLMDRAAELGATDYLLKGGGWKSCCTASKRNLPAAKGNLDATKMWHGRLARVF